MKQLLIKEVTIVSSFKRGLQFSEEKMNGNEGIVWKKNEKKMNSRWKNRKEQYYVNHDIKNAWYT